MERCDCKTNGPCLLSRRELPDDQRCVECYCAGYFCANDECECICHPIRTSNLHIGPKPHFDSELFDTYLGLPISPYSM